MEGINFPDPAIESIISAIKDMASLTSLYLPVNQISDISSLKGLTNLRGIY